MPALASAKRCTTTHWRRSPSTASTAASSPGGTSSRSATVPRTPLRRGGPPPPENARAPAPDPSRPPPTPPRAARPLRGEPFPAPLELGLPLAKLADRSGELRPLARGAHRVQAKGLEPFPVGQGPPPERSHLGLQRLHLSLPSALRGQELLQLALPGMPVGVETADAPLNQADFLFEPQVFFAGCARGYVARRVVGRNGVGERETRRGPRVEVRQAV